MPKIISNTSCLIVLDNINALDILHKLYQNMATNLRRDTFDYEQSQSHLPKSR